MKRLFFILCTLLLCEGLYAQNANRSGSFIELAGGATVGNSPVQSGTIVSDFHPGSDNNDAVIDLYRKIEKTGGAGLSIGVGYRWATSIHFAFEVKLQAVANTTDFTKTMALNIKPDIRYTSREISGSTSLYANANIGLGTFLDNSTMSVPYEVGVGFNFGNHISAGLIWDAQYALSKHEYHGKHYGMFGIRLGYKF